MAIARIGSLRKLNLIRAATLLVPIQRCRDSGAYLSQQTSGFRLQYWARCTGRLGDWGHPCSL